MLSYSSKLRTIPGFTAGEELCSGEQGEKIHNPRSSAALAQRGMTGRIDLKVDHRSDSDVRREAKKLLRKLGAHA